MVDEILRVVGFWLELGFDGFRVDGIPFMEQNAKNIGGPGPRGGPARADPRLQPELVRLGRVPLVIIDEVGYIPFQGEAANLFFQLVASRYERASVLVSSNKPFSRWGEVFGDDTVAAAMIDRLVHHADIINLKGDWLPAQRSRPSAAGPLSPRSADPMPEIPLRHDPVTIPCLRCGRPITPAGKRRYCTDACKAAAYRRRKQATTTPVIVPPTRPRKPVTVYECDTAAPASSATSAARSAEAFMRRVGIGGHCPHCDEPVAITDLLDEEVTH